jgi:hypothetical protein
MKKLVKIISEFSKYIANYYRKGKEISPYSKIIKKSKIKPEDNIEEKWRLINKNGEYELPLKYNYIESCYNTNLVRYFKVFKGLNRKENLFIWNHDEEDDQEDFFSYNNSKKAYKWWNDYLNGSFTSCIYVISTWKGNHLGLVDINNNVIIPFKYSWMKFITSELLIISKDSEIINFYDKDCDGENTYLMNGKTGVIHISNKLLIPIKYDSIKLIDNKIYAQNNKVYAQNVRYFNQNEPHDIYDLNGNKLK